MKDPQPAQAGTPGEDPAAQTATESSADYQFSSRKARRIAELTGMIPIVVPAQQQKKLGDSEAKIAEGDTEAPQEVQAIKPDAEASLPTPAATVTPAAAKASAQVPGPVAASAHADTVADGVEAKAKNIGKSQEDSKLAEPSLINGGTTANADVEDETENTAAGMPNSELASAPVAAAKASAAPAKKFHGSAKVAVPAAPVPVAPFAQNHLDGLPEMMAAEKPKRTPKAGRDLPAAIGVGVVLLALVLGTMLFFPMAFVAVASIFGAVGVWEVSRAIAGKGIQIPVTPVMVGALSMPASAYFGGSEGLLFALVASCGATLLWRSLDSSEGAVKSILAGIFTLLWVPFLLSFVFLMIRGENGPVYGLTLDLHNINHGVLQVVVMLVLVVANDTFGYLVGVLFGKHPMAPKISPKKSWEGFAGSMGGALLVGVPMTVYVLHEHWWVGVALAIGMVLAGTGGDFAESMIKRELGIKDMSNLLPGHGGVMDRLDSILFAAPVAYATFAVLGRF